MTTVSARRKAAHEWTNVPACPGMPARALEAIARRRRQMLIHSYIYYALDNTLVSDDTWQKWANQLVKLQAKFGRRIGFYDKAFADWDASTGYHLPKDANIERVAHRLLQSQLDSVLE